MILVKMLETAVMLEERGSFKTMPSPSVKNSRQKYVFCGGSETSPLQLGV